LHHQRHPLGDLRVVLGILHRLEQRAGLQRLVALPEEADVVVAPDETHVRGGIDERTRVLKHPLLDLPGEELTGDLERLIDLHRLADVDLAVLLRRVVELGQRRVASAGVVPAVGALLRHLVQALDHLHRPTRLQLVEPHRQGGTHDAAAHQQHIDALAVGGLGMQPQGQGEGRQGPSGRFLDVHVLSRIGHSVRLEDKLSRVFCSGMVAVFSRPLPRDKASSASSIIARFQRSGI